MKSFAFVLALCFGLIQIASYQSIHSGDVPSPVTANPETALSLPEPEYFKAPNKKRRIKLNKRKYNVLFIAVDDLRPQLGCYGNRNVISPNIDRLAQDGIVFLNAYCQQAVCAPSRASLLSGCRPDTTRIRNLSTLLRSAMPDVITLPQKFKENGYRTISIGKIYHHLKDDPQGWSCPPYRSSALTYASKEAQSIWKSSAVKSTSDKKKGPAYESANVPDNAYADGANTDYAIRKLRDLKKDGQPFFLAVGYSKPHLPFNAPQKYWDLYQEEDLPLATNPLPPQNVTPFSLTNFGELRSYSGMPKKGAIPSVQARKLIHGYQACVSYVDAQIGRVLQELQHLALRDDTIVIIWGDHGWKLGEHGAWCKHTNFENDTRVPLIVSIPGMKNCQLKTRALVEFVDIYPTLCEVCALHIPDNLEGISFLPLLSDPDRKWKKAAFSQYPRGSSIMGYSIRTHQYRYSEWQNLSDKKKCKARELYAHDQDPDENNNLAADPRYAQLIKKLSLMLEKGWRAALPD